MEKIRKLEKEIRYFIILFYGVGIVGLSFEKSFAFFVSLIPFALLLSATLLIVFHQPTVTGKSIAVFASIFLSGIAIEIAGVKTGVIFGSYHYGNSLGLKIWDTPVLIGVNWLLLVYVTAAMVEKWRIHAVLKPAIAAFAMVAYDLVLEQIAPKTNMWFWAENRVPIQNYAAWFLIALAFQSGIAANRIKCTNPLGITIFVCQLAFFTLLTFVLI